MKDKLPQLMIMISGVALILAGLVLVVLQIQHEMSMPSFTPAPRSIETTPTGGIKLSTTYVGLVVMAIGAALEIVGFVAATPWRNSTRVREKALRKRK
jgi:uncharacterized membrane protein